MSDSKLKNSIKSEQLMVTFAAGYIAGVFCAIVSHPADSVVSVINKNPGKSAGESELTNRKMVVKFVVFFVNFVDFNDFDD